VGKKGRTSIAEIATRRKDVKDMIMQGKGKQHIVAYITGNYGIRLSTIENDITIVYKDLKEYIIKHKDDVISEHIGRYDHIYEICLEVGNTDGAMKAMLQKEKLMKLHDTPTVVINNNTLNMFEDLSLDKLLEIKKIISTE
jgi:hypothetical protein